MVVLPGQARCHRVSQGRQRSQWWLWGLKAALRQVMPPPGDQAGCGAATGSVGVEGKGKLL